MSNKKQTAVEWLESNLPIVFKDLTINKQLIEQAKEMDKQQKIEDYRSGRTDQQSDRTSKSYNRLAADYYKETYGE
jgi:hypothetical protein